MKIKKKTALLIFVCVATTLITACATVAKLLTKPKPDEVTFRTDICELLVGDEVILDVRYEQDKNKALVFTSSDESVVKVDERGVLQAMANGSATVTVKYGNASDECEVTVTTGGDGLFDSWRKR